MLRELIESYPELAALIVLVLGFVLGKLAELGVRRLFTWGDRLVGRYGGGGRYIIAPIFQRGFALLVFALVLAMAAVIAVRLLAIEQLTAWLDNLLAYLPRFVLGLFIIGLGNVIGALLRNLTAGVLAQGDGNALFPRLVHLGVVVIAVITGLQQMGIDISFITQLSLIALGALLGGLSLAFALGARQYVANLVAQPELARYASGERLRIDDAEGVVVDIYRTGLTLSTAQGLVSIPASRLASGPVLRVTQEPTSEQNSPEKASPPEADTQANNNQQSGEA